MSYCCVACMSPCASTLCLESLQSCHGACASNSCLIYIPEHSQIKHRNSILCHDSEHVGQACPVFLTTSMLSAHPIQASYRSELLQLRAAAKHASKAMQAATAAMLQCRRKSTGDLIAQGNHVEYSAGGAPYPSTIEEYHKQQQSRQQSSKL